MGRLTEESEVGRNDRYISIVHISYRLVSFHLDVINELISGEFSAEFLKVYQNIENVKLHVFHLKKRINPLTIPFFTPIATGS